MALGMVIGNSADLNRRRIVAEKRTEVRTFMVRLMCDKCGEGEMKPTGVQLLSNPPQYPHRCDKCGFETTIRGGKAYPRIDYEEVTLNAGNERAGSPLLD